MLTKCSNVRSQTDQSPCPIVDTRRSHDLETSRHHVDLAVGPGYSRRALVEVTIERVVRIDRHRLTFRQSLPRT
jgi:hypothetical protein